MMLETRGQRNFFAWDLLRLLSALIVALSLILFFREVILSGYSIEGLLGIGGTISLAVGAFLYRDISNRKQRDNRDNR